MDKALSDELGVIYIDIPGFYRVFPGNILELETASQDIFYKHPKTFSISIPKKYSYCFLWTCF
ncbi:hypothetical protein F5B18DRAFT_616536 [Nemania serpens]|nr:hypothetical protein F5B18DRAFT_616536 [Nemania serpens]